MEQQTYKTDAAIYDVLEREIIDLTIRPGSSLSENPLCTRFGAPRSLIRVVLQKLQENGLVKIVPYKGTTVTRLNREIVEELIYERTAVEARVLRDFSPRCTPEQRALIRKRAAAYEALAIKLALQPQKDPRRRAFTLRRGSFFCGVGENAWPWGKGRRHGYSILARFSTKLRVSFWAKYGVYWMPICSQLLGTTA